MSGFKKPYGLPPLECLYHLLELSKRNPTSELFKFLKDELGDQFYELFLEQASLYSIVTNKGIELTLSSWGLSDSSNYKLENWTEALIIPDEEFWKIFHVSKTTLNFIRKGVQVDILRRDEFKNSASFNEYVLKIILLSIWYLRNNDSINECSRIFEIPLETIDNDLMKGFGLLISVRPPPDIFDLTEIRDYFHKYSRSSILGVLGYHYFETEDGKKINTVFVCNHKYEFMTFDTSSHPNVCFTLTQSPRLQNFINEIIPNGSYVIAFKDYERYPQNILKIVVPRDNDEDAVIDNKTLYQLLPIAHLALLKLVARFPRLSKLHKQTPLAIKAGFNLHNVCLFNNDVLPLL